MKNGHKRDYKQGVKAGRQIDSSEATEKTGILKIDSPRIVHMEQSNQ